MDTAVALVETYLRVNGYFTVTEYPVIEPSREGGYRTVTDLDVLAVRFPQARHVIRREINASGPRTLVPDPRLDVSSETADMIIGEVKEGRAELNRGASDPNVLNSALTRFGCCSHERAPALVKRLLQKGQVLTDTGHNIRLMAFGSMAAPDSMRYGTITLGHVTNFLREYIRQHWSILRSADFKDPAFGFLVLQEKAEQGLKGDTPVFDLGSPKAP